MPSARPRRMPQSPEELRGVAEEVKAALAAWLAPRGLSFNEDKTKIVALTSLVEKMQVDVHLFVHGYHTCCVERANSERTAYTSKRVELYRNWRGKCKLVQLLHNHGATATAG